MKNFLVSILMFLTFIAIILGTAGLTLLYLANIPADFLDEILSSIRDDAEEDSKKYKLQVDGELENNLRYATRLVNLYSGFSSESIGDADKVVDSLNCILSYIKKV